MRHVIPGLSPASYQRHALHALTRDWPETNCYVDLWIEVLAALAQDPVIALGFTVRQDFEGDQFTFFKFPTSDLELLYGVECLELAVFDDVIGHIEEQTARGRMPLIEVDGFYLPDTKGISHRTEHTKTTIGINSIDAPQRRVEYFHNSGYFALEGDDFDGLFRLLAHQRNDAEALFPYCEFIKLDRTKSPEAPHRMALGLLSRHLSVRPRANPITAFKNQFKHHAEKLGSKPQAYFHKYTFNVLRQLGANHELLSSHLAWLQAGGTPGLERAITKTAEISAGAKTMQFLLARAVARRNFASFDAALDRMAEAYDQAFADMLSAVGPA